MPTTRRDRRTVTIAVLALATLALVAAGCGDDDTAAGPTTTSTTVPTTESPTTESPTTESPTTTAPPTTAVPTTTPDDSGAPVPEGSGCSPGEGSLPDGHWYGLAAATAPGSLTFDLACWYTGEDATVAAAEDGEESPPPNDYYVRNDNTATRDLPVADGTAVTWYPSGDPTDTAESTYDEWRAARAERGFQFAIWIDVTDGAVTSIEEQWVP